MTLADGQPVEFPIEQAGAQAEIEGVMITLTPTGRGVENGVHKFIAYDSGEKELYDEVLDSDGFSNLAADPAHAATLTAMESRLVDFPAASLPMEAIPVSAPEPEVPKVTAPEH